MIARVEPLTTTRRLSGPVRLPRRRARRGRLARAHPVRAPEARRRRRRRSPRRPTCRTRSSSTSRPCAATRSRATWSTSRCGWPRSTARRPRARWRWSRRRPGKAKTAFWAEPTGADGRVNDNQRALLARLPGPGGRRPGRAAPAREARAGDDHRARRRGARRARTRRRTALVELTRRPDRRAGGDRGRAGRARTCCTASPARARPRSTCARPPRRWSAGRA